MEWEGGKERARERERDKDNGVHRNGEIQGEFLRQSLEKSITRHEKKKKISFLNFAFEIQKNKRSRP